MATSALIPLVIVVVVVGFLAAVGFIAYGIAQGVGNTTREKMEKKNLVFSKEGMKVGVKEVSQEAEKDRSQRCVLSASLRDVMRQTTANVVPVSW
jgi:predicted membrane protein